MLITRTRYDGTTNTLEYLGETHIEGRTESSPNSEWGYIVLYIGGHYVAQVPAYGTLEVTYESR